jgi:hypothetical protein
MSIAEFEQLNKFEKAAALNSFGVFISERRLGINRIYLFALNSFYVELFHNLSNPDNRELTVYRVFTDPGYLDVYLENVDISVLVETE